MATIKSQSLMTLSPILWIWLGGLLFILAGCRTANTPDGVALEFWQAMAANDLTAAQEHVTKKSLPLTKNPELPALRNAELKTGQIIINDTQATVAIIATVNQQRSLTLQTFLTKEHNEWKVDYQLTVANLRQAPFNDFFKSLENIGGTLNQQLEQGLEIFGEELKK
ncbi:MAG: hypothetical protein HOP02_17105 [Methylococcaceae bacterium]|nr:hypothetical protein [Methylococcaceae bacterium]